LYRSSFFNINPIVFSYIIDGSDSGYFDASYFKNLSNDELRLARNEIYARHGYRFSDKGLTQFYHSGGLWYGTALLKAQNPLVLTEIEKLNVELIATIEKERKQASTNQ
jgi:hypothetical protein